jgi:mono/diheme cytochrome c family protein
MSRPWVAPLAAGLATAAVVFALVAMASDDGGDGATRAGERARADAAGPATPAVSQAGREVFARMGCGSCHRLAAAGSEGEIGPDLDDRLPSHDRVSLIGVITDSDRGGEFVQMPENFGERMNAAELDALVDFLLAARRDEG